MKGPNLITRLGCLRLCYESRTVQERYLENVVVVLWQAIGGFGMPVTLPSDNGSCFVGAGGHKKSSGTWTPIVFENELRTLDMGLINL